MSTSGWDITGKVAYTEEIELSLKQIFILQEMYAIKDHEISYGFSKYDYLHSQYHLGYSSKIDEVRSMQKDFCGLSSNGLIEKSDDGSEYSYIRYKISKKGLQIYPQIASVDTSCYHCYRPNYLK